MWPPLTYKPCAMLQNVLNVLDMSS